MTIRIGNAPCSWGVEFADDPRNPQWQSVLRECAAAGYSGIELGPVGFMPEDPVRLAEALAEYDLTLIAGVVFRAFHDPRAHEDVLDATHRTAAALRAHGAQYLVLIDSISARRAPTAGRPHEAVQMDPAEWAAYRDRIAQSARIATTEYGLRACIHAHAAGFMDFEPELERLLDEVDEDLLKICFDTGHHAYAGYDPVAFMQRHMGRIAYVHFKDICAAVKRHVIANRTGFYQACGEGIFCRLGEGEVDFPAVRQILLKTGYKGWCTVEQDCDPALNPDPIGDARKNRAYLESIGFR